jgi:peptidyl-prolyl cis-trans isomerase D
MLNLMRKHASSWMIKFILGAVILAFIPFGYGVYQDRRDAEVANVNGDSIVYEDFNRVYNNLIVQMRQNFGDSLNEDTIKMLRLKQQAIDRLIEEKLLLAEAERLNLRVSDEELTEIIGSFEAFQTAGVFDSRRYEYILDRNRLSKEIFEDQQKKALLVNKLRDFISIGAKVSEAEAKQWYQWNNASVNLDYVAFSPTKYKGIVPTEEEIQAYFEENKESYKTQTKLKARFLRFDPDTFKADVKIAEEEIREYYEANSEEFFTPKTVEARHILIKVDEGADEQTVEQTRKRAEDIHQMAKDGKDFTELAVQFSEGPTAKNGGSLGAFRKEAMVKPFSDKAFAMQPGEISEPVRTRFGWHIIKVEKVNEARTLSLEDARKKITNNLTLERARALAYDQAEQVYDASFEGDDLVRNAADRQMTVHETEFFTRNKGPVKGVKDPAKFAAAAFELNLMDISEIKEFGNSIYLLQVIEKMEPEIPDLKTVAAKVKADLIKEKQKEKAGQDAEKFLAALKEGQAFAAESERFGVKPESTGFFKRNAPIPNIGYDRELAGAAFGLSGADKLPDKAFQVNNSYYVIQFLAKKEPPDEDFEKEKDQIIERLLQQKKFKTIENWLAEKRKSSEITIEEKFIE